MLRRLVSMSFVLMILMSNSIAQEATLQGAEEVRARALFRELRCVVCQNQSIDGSNADVARDLREIVREQISSGKTDTDIRNFLVARYGEFVLLKPKFAFHTLLLWGAPLLLLVVGGLLLLRRQRGSSSEPLSPAEQEKLASILARDAE